METNHIDYYIENYPCVEMVRSQKKKKKILGKIEIYG